jgi:hypothetical protein
MAAPRLPQWIRGRRRFYESNYREHPVSCADYPWFARTFMRPHIEIENDPSVWNRIEGLIRAEIL